MTSHNKFRKSENVGKPGNTAVLNKAAGGKRLTSEFQISQLPLKQFICILSRLSLGKVHLVLVFFCNGGRMATLVHSFQIFNVSE